MKTIFDKVDPKYIDCAAGTCEHVSHAMNLLMYITVVILTTLCIYKLKTQKV